eukprot:scaffold64165_cov24-Phaeocystis_antarctica.AAC.1
MGSPSARRRLRGSAARVGRAGRPETTSGALVPPAPPPARGGLQPAPRARARPAVATAIRGSCAAAAARRAALAWVA